MRRVEPLHCKKTVQEPKKNPAEVGYGYNGERRHERPLRLQILVSGGASEPMEDGK